MADALPSAQITPTKVGKYVYTLGPSHTVVNANVSVKPYAPPRYAALVIMNFWCLIHLSQRLILIFGWSTFKLILLVWISKSLTTCHSGWTTCTSNEIYGNIWQDVSPGFAGSRYL
jgi:hypothetical protein